MQIFCPECDAGYEIDELLLEDKKRRLKCSNCGKIFNVDEAVYHAVDKQDEISGHIEQPVSKDEPDEVEDNADLEKIFERLSDHTKLLIKQENSLPFYEKTWLQIKNILGFHFKIRWLYIFFAVVAFSSLSLYNNRYQVVREFPFFNSVYKFLGIKAKIPGEGLEFQNISWEFLKEEDGNKLEIKGFVFNQLPRKVDFPVVHIEILDQEMALLQSQNREIEEDTIDSNARVPLKLILENPAPTAKYVYLTFIDKD